MADDDLKERIEVTPEPTSENVDSRAGSVPEEKGKVQDDSSVAEAVLTESESRKSDPAVHDLSDDRIERRTSDERIGEEDS
ncbi:MAG TPA: hypothetical protein VND22_08010 [Actinomycetota bacterium]|nr:hypothetical protein [Actinomycetota bacterium]